MQSLDILRPYDVVLCDLDGVLLRGRAAIDGAPEFLAELRRTGPPVCFLTNNGSSLPEEIETWLARLGFDIAAHELVTAGEVLVDALPAHDLVGALSINLGNASAAAYIERAGGQVLPVEEARPRFREARGVVVGSTVQLEKNVLDAACNAVYVNHVPVLCTNPDVFVPASPGEITFVAGGLANLFERELGAAVHRLGKPHRPIFDLALRRLGERLGQVPSRVLVIDDNLESGIRGGHACGFDTLLVLSGWHRSREEAEGEMRRLGVHPTYVLDSVAH